MNQMAAIDTTSAIPAPARPGETPAFEMAEVTHRYGNVVALDNVSVSARRGEFLTLLGHSGSGKTSLLKVLAGLETPTSIRTLAIDRHDARGLPAYRRNTTTVFQNYALFPHMTVVDNVAYGLKVRGIDIATRMERALAALDMVRLTGLQDRGVSQLSGGERQRVALARAIVTRPAVLLLDEPLGALDERLRIDMQVELLELQRQLGTTFLYVTHSQEEALTMSDRIVLLNHGRIMQEGPPQALFDRPANRFVAEFMGIENLIRGVLRGASGASATVASEGAQLFGIWTDSGPPVTGAAAVAAVRAERLQLVRAAPEGRYNTVPCTLEQSIYKGKYLDQIVKTPVGRLKVRLWDVARLDRDATHVCWRHEDCAIVLS